MFEFDLLSIAVEDVSGINKETLTSKRRHRNLVELRSICCNIMKVHNNSVNVNKLGELLNVSHCTITHYDKLNKILMFQRDGKYKDLYEKINERYCFHVIKSRGYIDFIFEKKKLLKRIDELNSALIEITKNKSIAKL